MAKRKMVVMVKTTSEERDREKKKGVGGAPKCGGRKKIRKKKTQKVALIRGGERLARSIMLVKGNERGRRQKKNHWGGRQIHKSGPTERGTGGNVKKRQRK